MKAMSKELGSDHSSHLKGQKFMMRMGENGIKDTWILKKETSWNDDGGLCPDSRNKRTEVNSLHLGRLHGMLQQCSISRFEISHRC